MKIALTSVVDDDFFIGFKTFIYSLYLHNPEFAQYPYLVMNAGLSSDNIEYLYKHYSNIKVIRPKSLPNLSNSRHLTRLTTAYYKFDAYSNSEYDRLVLIDCDMLVIKKIDLDDILNTPDNTISACPCCYHDRGISDEFNSGLVIIPKHINYREKLIAKINSSNSKLADQGVLNSTFTNYNRLNKSLNVEKRVIPNKISLADTTIIHFVGDIKPWHNKNIRENQYIHLYLIWDEYFKNNKLL